MTDLRSLVSRIDGILPQTQCRQCGFPGCEPYAYAIAGGEAGIDRCAPGGEQGIRRLAALLGVPPPPLDTRYGIAKPRAVARIEETACIGCTPCTSVCPVDAIIGASRQMHTVITAECTGCELCVPPCPIDCITMMPTEPAPAHAAQQAADRARRRHRSRLRRLERDGRASERELPGTAAAESGPPALGPRDLKHAIIQAALEKARQG